MGHDVNVRMYPPSPSIQALDKEVEKIVLFFLKIQGDIANKLLRLRICMKALPVDDATYRKMATDESLLTSAGNNITSIKTSKSDESAPPR